MLQSRVDLRAARKSLLARRGPLRDYLARSQPQALKAPCWRPLCKPQKMTIRPLEYKPPPRRTYTDLGWIFAALTGPATLLAVWIYCAVTYGLFLGFLLGWIPALILSLLVAVATIFLWPLAAVVNAVM
jgi:hypothetical protein